MGGQCADSVSDRGQTYTMPIHGIVRTETWMVANKGESHATLEISDSEDSRQCYRFRWNLAVRFELSELKLTVRYTVTNRDNRTLYFSLGSHPGFNLDFGSDCLSDYALRTPNTGTPLQRRRIVDGKLSKALFDVGWEGQDLPLSDTTFDEDAIVFTGIECTQLTLLHSHDGVSIPA